METPEPGWLAGELYDFMSRSMLLQAVFAAVELGVADDLAGGPVTAEDVAAARGYRPGPLYRLLRALAGLGITAEDDRRRFALTESGRSLVTGGMAHAAASFFAAPVTQTGWGRLADAVRTGESGVALAHGVPLFPYLQAHPEQLAVFQAWMTARSAAQVPGILAACDFSRFSKIVDVGGGHGALLAAILRAHVHAHGVLFDRPEVTAHATAVADAGLAGRCDVVTGDFFTAVPQGGDCYLLKAILHDWDDPASARILGQIRAAMAPTGAVLIIEAVVPPGNDFDLAKFLDMHMMALTDSGLERTQEQFAHLLTGCGLDLVRVTAAGPQTNVLEARAV